MSKELGAKLIRNALTLAVLGSSACTPEVNISYPVCDFSTVIHGNTIGLTETLKEDEYFRSLNFPVKMRVPDGWIATSEELNGKLQDILKDSKSGVNIAVECNPVATWVTPEGYAQNVLNKAKKADPNAKMLNQDTLKIMGNTTFIIEDKTGTPDILNTHYKGVQHLRALSVDDTVDYKRNAWIVTLSVPISYDSNGNTYGGDQKLNLGKIAFKEVVSSLTLVSDNLTP